MKNPFLIGVKIYLRTLEGEDAEAVAGWFNDPEVTRTLKRHRPMSLAAERGFIERAGQNEDDVVLGIVVKQGDRLIGVTGLHHIDYRNRHTSFGIAIGDKSEWNKGYGTEVTGLMVRYAFETLNMNRIWLHVYENNPRGLRTYEKIGFKKEGVLRQECYREGRYWDTITMAILREEWTGPASS